MSVTELSLNRLLADELDRLGVKTVVETSFPLPTGSRIQTDVYLDGFHVGVEGKLGDQGRFVQAMGQLWNLQKAGLRGGFIVIYDERLKQRLRDLRAEALEATNEVYVFLRDGPTSLKFKGGLGEVASWIKVQLEKPPVVEVDISATIDVLRKAVNYLSESLKSFSSSMVEDIFGGKTVFENILQYGEGEYPAGTMRSAAAYLLMNQILFYHNLSATDSQRFPPIDEDVLKHPADLRESFAHALAVDYQAVYSFDVASRLPKQTVEHLKTIIGAVKLLGPEKIRHDFLGQVFHDMIPLEVRKPVAAFYTNIYAAELLASLAVGKADDEVMDLAVGSGGLLVAAYRAKKRLADEAFNENMHRKFVEEHLTGIDIMPFAAHLATVNLSLQAPLYQTNKVRIAVWDSTELKPEQEIPLVSRVIKQAYRMPTLDTFAEDRRISLGDTAYIKKGVYALEGEARERIHIKKVGVIIMNPPFTRQERIPTNYKEELNKRFREYRDSLHGQLGYYGYFILLADRFLKEDGRIALVLPATVLRAQSCEGIRKFLIKNYIIEFIINTWARSAFSESVHFREILLVARKRNSQTLPCLLTTIKKLPTDFTQARELAQKLLEVKTKPLLGILDTDNLMVSQLDQIELSCNVKNLFRLIAVKNIWLNEIWSDFVTHAKSKFVRLQDFLSSQNTRLVRGTEMTFGGLESEALTILSKKERAIKSSDIWILHEIGKRYITAKHRFKGDHVMIPRKVVSPALRRVALIDKLDLSDGSDFVITDYYAGLGELLKLATESENKINIKKWKHYVKERSGNLALVRRPDLSASGTCLLAFYSKVEITPSKMAWSVKLEDKQAIVLSLWFNSTLHILQILLNRIETRGALIECSGYILEDFLTLDPLNLPKRELKKLLSVFNRLKKVTFSSLLEQLKTGSPSRMELDKAILRVIGYSEEECKELLSKLYKALVEEIELLKEMMAEKAPEPEG